MARRRKKSVKGDTRKNLEAGESEPNNLILTIGIRFLLLPVLGSEQKKAKGKIPLNRKRDGAVQTRPPISQKLRTKEFH